MAEEQTERGIVTIDSVQYYVDSMTKEAQTALNDTRVIDEEMRRLETSFNIARVAKEAMMSKVATDIATFEVVPGQTLETPAVETEVVA